MQARTILAVTVSAVALLTGTACTVARDQQTVGSYVDDTALTTRVKAKFAEDPTVAMLAINVKTFKGVVQLSGIAKSWEEKRRAGELARSTSGVVDVKNDITVG